jgi:hypothetical protein
MSRMAARPTPFVPLAVGALALGGVVILFQSILEPVRDGCNTSLVPSTFATALVPAHLAAAVVLAGCIWAISGPDPGPWTRRGLAAALTYAVASAAVPALFTPVGFVAVFAAPTVGSLAVLALAIRTLVTMRSGWPAAERAREHAKTARWLLWLGLLLGLPASVAYAWLNAVSVFCF